jgi:phosphoglycolate phosphatase-like HAD superfamily hydrolase
MKLLLWDIDGTLLSTGGAGMRALEAATAAEFDLGDTVDLSGIDWAGRTDRWISRLILEQYNIEYTEQTARRLIDRYIEMLPTYLDTLTEVLPGVNSILQAYDQNADVVQGLLTGNMQKGARTKLAHFDLWSYFSFGAFADDSAVRNDLGPHALRRAQDQSGHTFHPTDVWVIGDTPHDIECGKIIGARTLAVATGHHSVDQLRAHDPDACWTSLDLVDKFQELLSH